MAGGLVGVPFLCFLSLGKQRKEGARPGKTGEVVWLCLNKKPPHGIMPAGMLALDVARTDSGGGLWAILETANLAGAIVKLELIDDDRQLLQVEVAREHYDGLNPKIGERLYVTPKKIRVFVEQS